MSMPRLLRRFAPSIAAHPASTNIAEANPHVGIEKAERELGWRADFRLQTR